MKLINMKKEPDDNGDDACCSPSKFGYGLTLQLDEDQCEKLGIAKALNAGTQLTLQAIAVVISATESLERDGDDSGPDVSVSLQITELGLTTSGVLKSAAKLLYGTGADDN
jgi:hypothetical protein